MWIRSQDETALIYATNIDVVEKDLGCKGKDEDKVWDMICVYEPDEYANLGRYTTKEKAKLVLDQIMDAIEAGKKTFSMPKEESVKNNHNPVLEQFKSIVNS